jgi:hypothetical protein
MVHFVNHYLRFILHFALQNRIKPFFLRSEFSAQITQIERPKGAFC